MQTLVARVEPAIDARRRAYRLGSYPGCLCKWRTPSSTDCGAKPGPGSQGSDWAEVAHSCQTDDSALIAVGHKAKRRPAGRRFPIHCFFLLFENLWLRGRDLIVFS